MSDNADVIRIANIAKPTVQVHRLRFDEQIAEKKYQLARLEAELKRFIEGTIKKMEADKIMLEREIAALMQQKDLLEQHGNNEVIDIKAITKQ
jgi:hypothetical protein